MDVNNLGTKELPEKISTDTSPDDKAPTPVKNSNTVITELTSDVKIDVQESKASTQIDLRKKANQAIATLNIASTATDEIERLVTSIGGIVDQAQTPELADNHRSILEKEAHQLVAEIQSKASSTQSDGIHPLLGDSVRLEVEQKYGDALEIILPDSAKNAFGLGEIKLSLKDSIIDTITRVEQAKKQFEELRSSVDQASASVRKTVDVLEVGLQNTEASRTSVRSLDEALSLATSTHRGIGKRPDLAIGSFNKLDLAAKDLLKT